ncbi:hypothetical protein LQF12_05825 [Ruania suaedae]|uniref:hypothetical protein n=1 Tax=Ruania suaedae TaxID=2897774 RepID=UPI001E316E55|nr:hypothetical protein [Ruania suaedae]UFU04105.1 hypothetical protein LQF12_05825 [Ruania suaedae]
MSMIPPVGAGGMADPDEPSRLSYAGLYAAADRERLLTTLGELGFTGWVGPQEGRWVLAIAVNARGAVASRRRMIDMVARECAEDLGVAVLAAEVAREERLQLVGFDGEGEQVRYDSNPPEEESHHAEMVLDEFGEPVMAEGAFDEPDGEEVARRLLALCGVQAQDSEADSLAELLEEELGESTNESERIKAVARALHLPTWIVASSSLPRRVPGGPERHEVTYLGRGRQGASGRFAAAWSNRVRKKAKDPERR